MSLPVVCDLAAYRGDTFAQQFRFKTGAVPVNLTGATIKSEARAKDGTKTTLVTTVEDATDGRIVLQLPAAGLPVGSYRYDIEVTKSGTVTTWVTGALMVTRDVTNELA